jgi:hypothetical protein
MKFRNPQVDLESLVSEFGIFSRLIRSRNFAANSLLNLSKPNPESLRIYNKHNGKFVRVRILVGLVKVFPIMLIALMREVIRWTIFASHERKYWQKFELRKFENIFISHYTHGVPGRQPDPFFGEILSSNCINSSVVVLLNHTRQSTKRVTGKLSAETSDSYFVVPKTLHLDNLLSTFKVQLIDSLTLLKYSCSSRELNNKQRLLLIDAAAHEFSRETFSIFVIVQYLKHLLSFGAIKRVVLTFEGHAFEGCITGMINNEFPNIKIALYQHAPVVPMQFGMFKALANFSENQTVLTTGSAIRDYLILRSGLEPSNIKEIGTPKRKPITLLEDLSVNQTIREKSVLIAPEGTPGANKEMIELVKNLSLTLPDFTFVFRPHPVTKIPRRTISSLSSPEFVNIVISNLNLDQDFLRTKFCVYRSSSVCIEGLAYGVVPLYFSRHFRAGLDPLAVTKLKHEEFMDTRELSIYLRNQALNLSTSSYPSHQDMIRAYQAYYGTLNLDMLSTL